MQPGTARKPARRKSSGVMPSNLEGTLSHHVAPPGAPEMATMSLRRNDSSTAFFSHWLTVQPSAPFSATRTSPLSKQVERLLDRVADDAGRAGGNALALLPHRLDRALQLGGVHVLDIGLPGFGIFT